MARYSQMVEGISAKGANDIPVVTVNWPSLTHRGIWSTPLPFLQSESKNGLTLPPLSIWRVIYSPYVGFHGRVELSPGGRRDSQRRTLHSVPTHIDGVSVHHSAQDVWKEGRRTYMARDSIRGVDTRRDIQIELDTESDGRTELD